MTPKYTKLMRQLAAVELDCDDTIYKEHIFRVMLDIAKIERLREAEARQELVRRN